MAEKPATPTAEQRLVSLEQGLRDARRQIEQMQRVGGFADSKMISVRANRIEERLEKVELDGSMLKDFTGLAADWMARHLHERHEILETDNQADSIFVRKIRRRLAEWAEKVGLMGQRRDVKSARADENRLRPSTLSTV